MGLKGGGDGWGDESEGTCSDGATRGRRCSKTFQVGRFLRCPRPNGSGSEGGLGKGSSEGVTMLLIASPYIGSIVGIHARFVHTTNDVRVMIDCLHLVEDSGGEGVEVLSRQGVQKAAQIDP